MTRASPLFEGHHQPQLPGELGFYDLRLPETREAQAALAREYGIYGFCYYYYWFNGKKLLHRPLDEVLASGKPDFPFCVCWANENWTRRWDGSDNEILIEQKYSESDDRDFIRSLIPAFRDPRYIRIDGKPLVLVYRTELFPNPLGTTAIWRDEASRVGMELYLVRGEGFSADKPESIGFDAAYEFPPNALPLNRLLFDPSQMEVFRPEEFDSKAYDYRKLAEVMMQNEEPGYMRFRTVMVAWDNTARRRNRGSIFLNGSPEEYQVWLSNAIRQTSRMPAECQLIFINAWNEWAEGCHLEPDQLFGRGYLEATLSALREPSDRGIEVSHGLDSGLSSSKSFEARASELADEGSDQLEAQGRISRGATNEMPRAEQKLPPGVRWESTPGQRLLDSYWFSTSWQATSPIRRLMRHLRGLPRESRPVVWSRAEAGKIVQSIRGSLSWKISAPIRWVGRFFPRAK